MTKITKKSSKKTYILVFLAIALISVLSFGVTFAWFTAKTKEVSNSGDGLLTTGYLHLKSGEVKITESSTTIFPGTPILAANSKLEIETNDEKGNYVAFVFTITAVDAKGVKIEEQTLKDNGVDVATALDSENWFFKEGIYVYGTGEVAKPASGKIDISTTGIMLNKTTNDLWDEENSSSPDYISDKKLMGAKLTITFKAASIQASGDIDEETAINELTKLLLPTD